MSKRISQIGIKYSTCDLICDVILQLLCLKLQYGKNRCIYIYILIVIMTGKRPAGLTLIPWRAGWSLIWDVTGSCTTADSYLEASSREARAAAELAASNEMVKYAGLSSQGEFVPTVVESHGPINRDALQFLSQLGRRLDDRGDVRASSFLFQRISVASVT